MTQKGPDNFVVQLLTTFAQSFQALFVVLRYRLPYLLSAWILLTGWNQFFIYFESQSQQDQTHLVLAILGQALGGMIGFLALIHLVPGWLARHDAGESQPKLGYLMLGFSIPLISEMLRAMVKTLIFTLMLIVPGILKWIDYSLVPLVVTLDPAYQSEKIDPLEASKSLLAGFRWTFLLFLVIDTGLYFIFDAAKHKWMMVQYPAIGTAVAAGSFLAYLWSLTFLYVVFRNRRQQVEG